MTDQRPNITPPPEMKEQWREQARDEELEACTAWLRRASYGHAPDLASNLRATRRPTPSLKEQALEALEDANLDAVHYNTILRALEALPDD